jgi:hypothetical protein
MTREGISWSPATTPRMAARAAIVEIASLNRDFYSAGLHRDADPHASAQFARAYVRRLEAMRRQRLAERLPDADGGPGRIISNARGVSRRGTDCSAQCA